VLAVAALHGCMRLPRRALRSFRLFYQQDKNSRSICICDTKSDFERKSRDFYSFLCVCVLLVFVSFISSLAVANPVVVQLDEFILPFQKEITFMYLNRYLLFFSDFWLMRISVFC